MARLGRREYLATLAAGGSVAAAGCLDSLSDSGRDTPIAIIEDGDFDQDTYEIAGPTSDDPKVEFGWENRDDQEHRIVSAEPEGGWEFESEPLAPDELVYAEFRSEGVYDIVCGIHGDPDDFENSDMKMKLIIGDATVENGDAPDDA